MKGFEVNRGMEITRDPATQMYIGMYFDEPGVWYNPQGIQVAETIAARAGISVDKYKKQRILRERMAKAKALFEAELEMNNAEVEKVIHKERGGIRIVLLPSGNAIVEDADGNKITPMPIAVSAAEELLDGLAPEPDEAGETGDAIVAEAVAAIGDGKKKSPFKPKGVKAAE